MPKRLHTSFVTQPLALASTFAALLSISLANSFSTPTPRWIAGTTSVRGIPAANAAMQGTHCPRPDAEPSSIAAGHDLAAMIRDQHHLIPAPDFVAFDIFDDRPERVEPPIDDHTGSVLA
jgi:hypothetical protein